MEDIFKDIHNIPWSDLKHAYGNAGDVPGLLMNLVHEDEDARQSALYELFGNIWHQGTVYEATSYVVPYLINLLKSSKTPNRESVAGLFAAIANGSGYLEVHAQPDAPFARTSDNTLSDSDADLKEQLAAEHEWVAAVRRAVDPHLDLLYEFIQHEVWDIRFEVASALGKYPNHAKDSLPILREAFEHEADDEIREAIVGSIKQLEEVGE
jgi:HEAT repeat protein